LNLENVRSFVQINVRHGQCIDPVILQRIAAAAPALVCARKWFPLSRKYRGDGKWISDQRCRGRASFTRVRPVTGMRGRS
jgi:hypothetical protein